MSRRFLITVAILSVAALISYLTYYIFAKDRPQARPDFSPASSIKISEESVTIDFATCTPDLKRVDSPVNSTIIEVRAKEFDVCLINYQIVERETNLNQKLTNHCVVPTNEEIETFRVINTGVDFAGIIEYCTL